MQKHTHVSLSRSLLVILNPIISQTSFNIYIRAIVSTMNNLLSTLLVTHINKCQWDVNICLCIWVTSFNIIFWIKFLLIISCKQISPLIVLSMNTPKPTRGLDALSIIFNWSNLQQKIKASKQGRKRDCGISLFLSFFLFWKELT